MRKLSNASERIQTLPNASGRIRTHLNGSEHVPKPSKTCENFQKPKSLPTFLKQNSRSSRLCRRCFTVKQPGRWRSWDVIYKFSADGNVKLGKKGKAQLVPAGSPADDVADANYSGKYFLRNRLEAGTWEYVWIEQGIMHVDHFSEKDTGTSPFGSQNFSISGRGSRGKRTQGESAGEKVSTEETSERAKRLRTSRW